MTYWLTCLLFIANSHIIIGKIPDDLMQIEEFIKRVSLILIIGQIVIDLILRQAPLNQQLLELDSVNVATLIDIQASEDKLSLFFISPMLFVKLVLNLPVTHAPNVFIKFIKANLLPSFLIKSFQ